MAENEELMSKMSEMAEAMKDLTEVIKELKAQKRQEVSSANAKSSDKNQSMQEKSSIKNWATANSAMSAVRNEDPVALISALSTKLGAMAAVVEKVTDVFTGLSERAGALDETHKTPKDKAVSAAASYAEQGIQLSDAQIGSIYETSRAMHQRRFKAMRRGEELLARSDNIVQSVIEDKTGLDIAGFRARTSTQIQEFYEQQGQYGINRRLEQSKIQAQAQKKIHQNRRVNESR